MNRAAEGTQDGVGHGTQEKRPKVEIVLIFANGNIAAFAKGKQVTPLQEKTVQELFVEFATSKGYDLRGCEIHLNNAKTTVSEYLALRTVASG
jgi:hypothetical protein